MGKIKEIHENLVNKEYSVAELVKTTLEKVKKTSPKLGTYITITEEQALADAAVVDNRIKNGEPISMLSGIPMGVKDNISTKGVRTTCASKMLENYTPIFDATVMKKLNKESPILIGKCNMDEFAMGSTSETSAFGTVKNPWSTNHVPGGSSGGSSATVAADEVVFSLGTDTGGSIRQPAAFCGIVGMKPTYGTVSRFGVVSYASSLDQVASFTKMVEDCAIVMETISGYDPLESTSVNRPNPSYSDGLGQSIKGLKIGVPTEYFKGDAVVMEKIKAALKMYESLGAIIEEVSIPHADYALPAYYIIASAEASSNLARFDGVRYGARVEDVEDVTDMMSETRGRFFGKEVKKRIMIGTYALSAGYYDAYYLKALKVRTLLKQDFDRAFDKFDILLTPVAPYLPYTIGEGYKDPVAMYLGDLCTASINLVGIPGLTIPCGFSEGLPIGLQLLGTPFSEKQLLNTAAVFEQNTDYHKQSPNMEVL